MQLSNNFILRGFFSAMGAVLYILGVAAFISRSENLAQSSPFLGVVLVLMLLVFSVAVMGVLFFLGPIWLYCENQKKSALKLLAWIFVWFFFFAASTFLLIETI